MNRRRAALRRRHRPRHDQLGRRLTSTPPSRCGARSRRSRCRSSSRRARSKPARRCPRFTTSRAGRIPPPAHCGCPGTQTDPDYAVGVFARDHGATVPGRLIASAKSWLCHSGVDRTAGAAAVARRAGCRRLSPVEASARYLAHIRAAWNHQFPGEPLEEQDVVLTLPASFDEVARELTVKAARQAGLAARGADRGAAGRLLRLDRRPPRRWRTACQAGPEDSGLRHRRRHDRFHADSRCSRSRAARCSSIAWPSASI